MGLYGQNSKIMNSSQSLGESVSVQSMSTESLQSAHSLGSSSAGWDSPSKTNTSKQSSSHLSALLSSDSDSDEEEANVNFVDMWKARSTPPIRLPDWDPNKSIEAHRRRVRESLERSESASSASSEQWILSHPILDDVKAKPGRPCGSIGSDNRQSSLTGGGIGRQDSANSARTAEAGGCEEDRRILEELLERERVAQSRSGSSEASPATKRREEVPKEPPPRQNSRGSPRTKRRAVPRGPNLPKPDSRKAVQRGPNDLPKPDSSNTLGEQSIMSDFVSSIMAEVNLNSVSASAADRACARKSKDDLVQQKKQPSNQFVRSKSMKLPSRTSKPERTRIPSGGGCHKTENGVTNFPKSNATSSKVASVKKCDVMSTKSPVPKQNASGSDVKKSGIGLSRTSFMPKALTRTTKPTSSLNVNQSRSGGSVVPANGPEKSAGKNKKSNSKYSKGKAKGDSTAKPKASVTRSSDKESSSSEKDMNLKNKSKIPQLIRQGLKPSPGKAEPNKKRVLTGKDIELKRPCDQISMSRTETSKEDYSVVSPSKSPQSDMMLNKTPSFVVEDVPFIDDSSKNPNSNSKTVKTPSPDGEQTPFSGKQELLAETSQRHSPKLSPRLLDRLRASGVELANSSSSDNDSVFLPDEPSEKPKPASSPEKQALQKSPSSADGSYISQKLASGCGSELQLDEREIEDIKNGVLIRETDAHSIGSWSAKSSEFGLKNTFLFGNGDFGNVGTPPSSRSLGRGSSGGRGSLAPSVSSNPEEQPDEASRPDNMQGEDMEAKKIDVPLVSSDLMEDFEAEELCEEDGMSSDREKEAQLTEKERANLLDSLFESDESEEGELDGFLDESSESVLDSHPDEQEFMKLMGDKGLKRQVIRQSMYCRVSLLQMDIYSHYNRFDDPEKEALASFDFLEEASVDNTAAGEARFADDHPLSVISPRAGVRSGMPEPAEGGSSGMRDGLGLSLLQAAETTESLFGEDPAEVTLDCGSFTSKRPFGSGGAQRRDGGPSSGGYGGHFDAESYGSRHSNKVFDGCYAIGEFGDQLGNRSNLCSSMSSSSTASLSSHE